MVDGGGMWRRVAKESGIGIVESAKPRFHGLCNLIVRLKRACGGRGGGEDIGGGDGGGERAEEDEIGGTAAGGGGEEEAEDSHRRRELGLGFGERRSG